MKRKRYYNCNMFVSTASLKILYSIFFNNFQFGICTYCIRVAEWIVLTSRTYLFCIRRDTANYLTYLRINICYRIRLRGGPIQLRMIMYEMFYSRMILIYLFNSYHHHHHHQHARDKNIKIVCTIHNQKSTMLGGGPRPRQRYGSVQLRWWWRWNNWRNTT